MEKKPAQVDADKVALPLVFIERGEDLAWLHDRLADAKASLGGARVVGEPGMGKTRLVREFLDQCAQNGDLVVVTGPDPAWAEVGYFALRKAIRELALLPDKVTDTAFVDAGPEAKQGLGYVFEIGTDGARLSAEERRFAVAEALRWAMVRGGERVKGRKVVVAVDDLALRSSSSATPRASTPAGRRRPPLGS
jgi:serine/threonine-protein kinase